MKHKILLFAALLIGGTALTGCDNDDDTPNDYYIRYTAKADIGEAVTISYTDEKGENRYHQSTCTDGQVQYTIGPVGKGFNAKLSAYYTDKGGPVHSLYIEAARQSGVFVTKCATSTDGSYYNISWKTE